MLHGLAQLISNALVDFSIRFSPKPSPHLVKQLEEEEMMAEEKAAKKVCRKSIQKTTSNAETFKSQNIEDSQKPKKSIYDSSRSSLNRVQKMSGKKSSPGDVNRSNIFKNKMKKVIPKMKQKGKEEQNLTWFDADSMFGF